LCLFFSSFLGIFPKIEIKRRNFQSFIFYEHFELKKLANLYFSYTKLISLKVPKCDSSFYCIWYFKNFSCSNSFKVILSEFIETSSHDWKFCFLEQGDEFNQRGS
jgi:hypothetical protein